LVVFNCCQLARARKWLAVPVDTGGILVDPGEALWLHVSFLLAEATLGGGLVSTAFAFASFSFGAGKLTGWRKGLSSGFGSFCVNHIDCNVVQVFNFHQLLVVHVSEAGNLALGSICIVDQLQAPGLLNGLTEHGWTLLHKRNLDGLAHSHEKAFLARASIITWHSLFLD
jgi:hypothetical protein